MFVIKLACDCRHELRENSNPTAKMVRAKSCTIEDHSIVPIGGIGWQRDLESVADAIMENDDLLELTNATFH